MEQFSLDELLIVSHHLLVKIEKWLVKITEIGITELPSDKYIYDPYLHEFEKRTGFSLLA